MCKPVNRWQDPKIGNLAIDQTLLIDRKAESTFGFLINRQFLSQLSLSNYIIANHIMLLSNINQKSLIDLKVIKNYFLTENIDRRNMIPKYVNKIKSPN